MDVNIIMYVRRKRLDLVHVSYKESESEEADAHGGVKANNRPLCIVVHRNRQESVPSAASKHQVATVVSE